MAFEKVIMRKEGYNFVTSPAILFLLFVSLYVSALYVPDKGYINEWIPILISFIDTSFYTRNVSIILSSLAMGFTAISLYFIGLKMLGTGKNKFILPLFYLIFALISSDSIFFSGNSFASPLLLWSLYFSILSKKSDLKCFLTGFLFSFSLLFDPHIALILPLVFYYIFISRGLSLRTIILIITSILLPLIFLFSVRFLLFEDAMMFSDLMMLDLLQISTFAFSLENVAEFIILAAYAVILASGILYILSFRTGYSIIKSLTHSRFILLLFFSLFLLILYPDTRGSLATIFAIPASVIASEYAGNFDKSNKSKIQLLVLFIFVIVGRISQFVY